MKLKIGYIIKSINNKYTIIVPIWKKNYKYKKMQLNIQKNFFYDNRNELSDNYIALVEVNSKKKKYNLIKILH